MAQTRVIAMDVRLAAALAQLDGERVNVSALCRRLGISRTMFYLYQRRFAEQGLEGLVPRSRRPHRCPGQTPAWIEEQIVACRERLLAEGWDAGAWSIRFWLARQGVDPPTARTIHRVLVRRGQVTPGKRPRSSWKRFQFAQPNGCWQMDGTSWALADGAEVVIIRVLDDRSRKVLGSRVTVEETGADAWACFAAAADVHGLPALVVTDNSLAFSARRRGWLVAFEARLRGLGVLPITSADRHPQTCWKKERENSPLKRWLRARPPAQTLGEGSPPHSRGAPVRLVRRERRGGITPAFVGTT